MKIKAICFDLDGVYFTPKGKNSFHQALINEYGISQEIIDEFMYRSIEMAQLVRGKIKPDEFWNKFRKITGIVASDQDLSDRWIKDYEVDNDVKKSVIRARELGYMTCVCTNNNAIRLPRLTEIFDLNNDFDVIVSSHEVGHTKPEPEIFTALLNRLNIGSNELVYSDDNPNRLAGAAEIGIQTFVFENFHQFIEKLKEFGIDLS